MFGQISRLASSRAKFSNGISSLRLVSVSRKYSNIERSRICASTLSESEKLSGRRCLRNSLGEVSFFIRRSLAQGTSPGEIKVLLPAGNNRPSRRTPASAGFLLQHGELLRRLQPDNLRQKMKESTRE